MLFPGQLIGTEEEYIPGDGTHVREGRIYASIVGELHIDAKHRATVLPAERIPQIKIGAIAYGVAVEIFKNVAFFDLELIETDERTRTVSIPGFLPITDVREGFVRSVRDEVRVGDIVKGVITRITSLGVQISTVPREMGVVKAFCTNCREQLKLLARVLKCERCGTTERRKLGVPYGTIPGLKI